MTTLLEQDLRDRCRSLTDIGDCYLADDNDEIEGDPNYVRYVPTYWITWDNMTENELQRTYLSPNGFEPSSAVGRSNEEYFVEKYGHLPGVIQTNFLGLAVRVADLTEEMVQEFYALHNYPVLDDDRHSQEEADCQREDWNNWV